VLSIKDGLDIPAKSLITGITQNVTRLNVFQQELALKI
jgi:hypothetical protein